MKHTIDWPQVAALAIAVAGAVAALVLVDPSKLEGWAAVLPALTSTAVAIYSASRGRAVTRGAP